MKQLEIEFFWPLTEQIPLDLDYRGCERPKLVSNQSLGQMVVMSEPQWQMANKIVFETDRVAFRVNEKPNLLRRLIYKLIGFDWELR